MKKFSYKAWRLLRKLNSEKQQNSSHVNITPNQIALHLVVNGKTKIKRRVRIHRTKEMEVNHFKEPFTIEELNEAIKVLKQRKAAGVDEVKSKQI